MSTHAEARERLVELLASAPQVVRDWLASYRGEKTHRTYQLGIALWLEWCRDHGVDPTDASREQVEQYQAWLTTAPGRGGRPRSKATRVRLVSTVASLYERIQEEAPPTYASPFVRVKREKVARGGKTKALTVEGARRLLAEAASRGSLVHAAVWFMLVTSGRADTVLSLRVADLTPRDGRLWARVRLKGDKELDLPLPDDLADALDKARGERTDGLLLEDGRGPWSYDVLYEEIRRAGDRVGLDITPHVMRATTITSLAHAGVPLTRVQRLAGHAQLSTTEGYVRSFDEAQELAETMDTMAALLRGEDTRA